MERNDELSIDLMDRIHFAAALLVVVPLSVAIDLGMRGIVATQNVAADFALAMGEPYARGRRIANERIGRLEDFVGSVMGGGDRC